jgi:hypothetical protein
MAGLQLYYVFFLVTGECVTEEVANGLTFWFARPITMLSLLFLQLTRLRIEEKQAYLPPNKARFALAILHMRLPSRNGSASK